MPSPQNETRTLDQLSNQLRSAGLVAADDPLTGAELLVGWEAAVVRTSDGWIHRFARTDAATFERELVVLDTVAGRLPVPSPRVDRVDHDLMVASYRTIVGAGLDLDRVLGVDAADRADVVRSLAETLAAMHDLGPLVTGRTPIPTADHAGIADRLSGEIDRAGERDRRGLVELLAAWRDSPAAESVADPVLLHGDYHLGNMVFADPTGPISGLWDFTCVELGDPAEDLRYLLGDSSRLTAEVADAYTALTGRRLDLSLAGLLRRVEEVCDALDEHRPIFW